MKPSTLILAGDSILDNAPYTHPEPDTTAHLERLLTPEWTVRRLAEDGAMMRDMGRQLRALEDRPTAIVLSIGGNDATEHIGVLERRATSAADVLEDLLVITESFGRRYETVARDVAHRADRTLLCTIYDVQLEPPPIARLARVPLALLNDQIVRVGAKLGLDVLELRSVCTDPGDFVQQIEPSPQGAAKIAEAVASVLRSDGVSSTRVFAVESGDGQ